MTQIPVMINITNASVHDVNAMDIIDYEPLAGYIFDRGYWDLIGFIRLRNMEPSLS